jgi:pilus assembly protein FimV
MYKTPNFGQGMGKKMNLITRGALTCALLLGASIAQAAGLGKLTVHSALGQILNAEIDLVSLQPGELDALSARVAPPEAFRDARIEYSSSLRLLRFAVDKRANGAPFIKITSVAPINEPFVDMLIEVSWPAGRVQREYPILLDPPGYSNRGAPPTVAAAPAAASRPADTPPATAPAASSSAPAKADSGAPSARTELASTPPGTPSSSAGSQSGSDTYGPVERGDTLNKIAQQVKPANVSLEQMLVALYRENQAAFVNNNMNRLKTGQILKVPSAEEVEKIAAKEANQEYRTHVADWNSYRGQVGDSVAAIPARTDSTSNVAAGRVASAAVTPPAPPAAESKDVLKLSKTDAGKAGAAKGGAGSQDRVNALQEEVTAKDKALRESQSRVADLEKQIRDMQRLLDLKSGAPAKVDPKVAAAPAKPEPAKVEPAKPAEPPKVAAATPPAPAKVEPAKPEPAKVEPPKTEAAKPADPPKPAEPPKVAEAKPAPPKTDAKAPAKKAPPPPEKGIVDEVMDNPAWLMGGIGVLAALGIGGFLLMRRRKGGAEAGPSSAMTSAFPSDLKPGSSAGKPAGGLVDTGNSSFLTDFDKSGPGTIDTDEVDPVAEAEVYIAYGRDAQAEEILKEAMARDKNRHEIPLKLLEIYHSRKSATAFETVAKELRAQVGDNSPLWAKAAAMGSQIDPTNPLYEAGAGSGAYSPAAPGAKPDVDFGIDQPSTNQPAPDFDLDVDPTKSGRGPDSTGSQSTASVLDFDIAPSAPAPEPVAEAPKEEKSSFDFDLSGLDFPGSKPGGGDSLETTNTPSPMADLSLDIGGGGDSEATGTKLELAKAYLDIGDKDGAREILQEVAKEGSADQRAEAEKLIASL